MVAGRFGVGGRGQTGPSRAMQGKSQDFFSLLPCLAHSCPCIAQDLTRLGPFFFTHSGKNRRSAQVPCSFRRYNRYRSFVFRPQPAEIVHWRGKNLGFRQVLHLSEQNCHFALREFRRAQVTSSSVRKPLVDGTDRWTIADGTDRSRSTPNDVSDGRHVPTSSALPV